MRRRPWRRLRRHAGVPAETVERGMPGLARPSHRTRVLTHSADFRRPLMSAPTPQAHDDRIAILMALAVMVATLGTLAARIVWGL